MKPSASMRLRIIGYLNDPAGVPALMEHLEKEPSRAVREAIFQALTRIDADGGN